MRRAALQLLAIATLLALGFWAWRAWFPSPEQQMRQRLIQLARTVSFASQEPPLTRLVNAQKLVACFTPDVEVFMDAGGRQLVVHGAEDLRAAALAARSSAEDLSVEFLDVSVRLAPDQQSAVANLTVRVAVNGEKNAYVQELKISWKNLDGEWRISRVESVKTLSVFPRWRLA